jgi:hypothetical protein
MILKPTCPLAGPTTTTTGSPIKCSPLSAVWNLIHAAVLVLLALGPQAAMPKSSWAQMGGRIGSAVGGIAIDADGIVRNLDQGALESLAAARRQSLAAANLPNEPGGLRKVSLARIVAAVVAGPPLTADMLFLGGLERITHVFVDPDGHDIILAGPADRAVVDARGDIVGATSGRPLLQLEDFLVALRAIDAARAGGMECSIDPSPEGIEALQRFLATQRVMGPDARAVFRGMEEALGPQSVRVGGVPADSRFARVLVAADYRMKRIGMGLEPSGLAELPSYLSMIPAGGKATALPRFWLEAEYDPIGRDADELAWRLAGRRMKCVTETDRMAQGGLERGRGRSDPAAQRWCTAMTTHYGKLAADNPVFAELENCVDLAVVAALIHGRQLADRAGLDLAPLRDEAALPLPTYDVPATVPTVATGIRRGTTWVLAASGGILFQPWQFATTTVAEADLDTARGTALAARNGGNWWWD